MDAEAKIAVFGRRSMKMLFLFLPNSCRQLFSRHYFAKYTSEILFLRLILISVLARLHLRL